MSCILHIETSTAVCSVAMSQDGGVIFEKEDREGPSHSVTCGVFVQEALSFVESHAIPLDAVAVSEGPGSYTGLRIGFSTAKGVAYGRGVPLITLPTLQVLTVPVLLYHDELEDNALLVPMIDARRMEVYTAVYNRALKTVMEVQPMVVDYGSFAAQLERGPVYFFGDGAAKCQEVIKHPNARFLPDVVPLARNMCPLAERKIALGEYADVAYSKPFYLKEFIATKPKKLL